MGKKGKQTFSKCYLVPHLFLRNLDCPRAEDFTEPKE